jgi:hypothetical protein
MADKDKLRDMLDAMIDDNDEKAQVDFHSFVVDKLKDTLDLNPADDEGEEEEIEIEKDED